MTKGTLNRLTFLVFLALFLPVVSVAAESNAIQRQASQYVESTYTPNKQDGDIISIKISSVDSRLKLANCRHDIHFSSKKPLVPGRILLKASCDSPKPWRIHLSGQIKLLREVVVTTTALPKGTVLSRQNLTRIPQDISTLTRGFYTAANELAGFELKRSSKQHQVITPHDIKPSLMVHKDDEVIISAGNKGLVEIRMAGIALQNGHKNQQIRVRNKQSGVVIKARITGPGHVQAGN